MAHIFPFTLNMAISLSAMTNREPDPGGIRSRFPASIKSATRVHSSVTHRHNLDGLHLFFPFAGVDVSAPALRSRVEPSVGLMHHKSHVAGFAVRWQAKVGEGFRC